MDPISVNQNADKESSTLEISMSRVGIDIPTIGSFQPHGTIAVQDIPGYILVDPAAFRQFLVMNNLQPYYQCSGRYSEESIQILHTEFSQLTEEEAADVAPLMRVSAEMALVERVVNRDNHYQIPAASPAFSTAMVNDCASTLLGSLSQKPGAWGIVDEQVKSYQNTMGKKEVEKWREKGDGQDAVVQEKVVSTMDLDTKMGSVTQDLVDSGWKPEVGEATSQLDTERANFLAMPVEQESWAEEKHETAEEPDTGYQPTSSNDFTGKAMRNPIVKHIRTASEWDPGPRKSTYTTPAILRNPKGIAAKPMSSEPVHPVVEFPWLLQLRFQWACHDSWMKSRCNCYGMSARFVSRIRRTLIGGDGRRQVWDPGGKEVKFNSVVQSGRMGRTDWQADRAGSEQRARARGACQEASIWDLRCLWSHRTVPGICWLRALFVCVGSARWER